jgi:UDP-glucuronate 4-epimerase
MKILVTGSAGFIGFHLSKQLLELSHEVVGIDNLNDYYDISLKLDRLSVLNKKPQFTFIKMDLIEEDKLLDLFEKQNFDVVFHLAAQAGVRYSIDNPKTYIESNIIGTFNILEQIRKHPRIRLYYASSSSVYGNSEEVPFTTSDRTDNPVSLYAATKKSTEVLAESYVNLYNLNLTGLRFFTVYGPWGRPDMAYFSFTKKIMSGEEILIFNNGNLERDFTYIDDIISPLISLMNYDNGNESVGHRIFNLGNNQPESLVNFLSILESKLGINANKKMVGMQKGDVLKTYANIEPLRKLIGYEPKVNLEQGLTSFVNWYKEYYMEKSK